MTGIAQQCVENLQSYITTVAQASTRAFYVSGVDDLERLGQGGLTLPLVGVVYEGMVGQQEPAPAGGNRSRGIIADLSCLVVVLVQDATVFGLDRKNEATTILDAIRKGMRDARSPTGHYWRFLIESPLPKVGEGVLAYGQRWATASPSI